MSKLKGERKEEREKDCKKRKSKQEEIGTQENSGGEVGGGQRAISFLNKERMGEGVVKKNTNGKAPGSGKIDCVIGSGSRSLIHSFVRSLLFRQVKYSPVCLSLLCPRV